MVSGELENSLRDEINDYLNSRVKGLQEEIVRLQSQLNEAFTRLLESTTDERAETSPVAASIAEHIRAAHELGIEQAVAESARAKASGDMALLKAAIEDIDDQRTQAGILEKLVNSAASFAQRVAFFVVRNEQTIGWRARGLEGTVGDEAIREVSIPLSADTLLGEVVRSGATWSGVPGTYPEDHLLLDKLGAEPPQHVVAVPLVVRGKAVAVLYADSAALGSDAINLEALEALVRVTGMSVELLAVQRAVPSDRHARIEPVVSPQPQQPEPETVSTHAVAATEEHESEATEAEEKGVAPYFAPAVRWDEEEAAPEAVAEPEAAFTQRAGMNGSPAYEPQTASSGVQQQVAPLGATRTYGSTDAELPVDVGEEERRLHNDARRFARLLVSEIKLYNEQKVREGRSQGDIYERLREDIDRSRQMYDKRVAAPVAARYDYFHQELVNTLAEGDPAKLGASYPGAAVSA